MSDEAAGEPLTRSSFEPIVGSNFEISADQARIIMKLDEVRELGNAMRQGGAFALYFQGPPHPALPQATYSLQNDKLGELAIFIVPIARTDSGIRYEAVFT